MTHLDWFDKIDRFYKDKIWDIEMVKHSVMLNKISKEQYKDITNEEYPA